MTLQVRPETVEVNGAELMQTYTFVNRNVPLPSVLVTV